MRDVCDDAWMGCVINKEVECVCVHICLDFYDRSCLRLQATFADVRRLVVDVPIVRSACSIESTAERSEDEREVEGMNTPNREGTGIYIRGVRRREESEKKSGDEEKKQGVASQRSSACVNW